MNIFLFFFSSRRRHTRCGRDWSSDVCSSDLTKSIFLELDKWIRRRLRMCLWKNWKKPKTKIRNLIQLGVPQWQAYEWGNTRKSYWRISNSPILHRTFGNSYWRNRGLKSLEARYENLRQLS